MFMLFRSPIARLTLAAFGVTAAMGAAAATGSVSHTYDPLGRIATALYDNGVCIAYVYDANGNRTAQTNTASTGPETAVWGSGTWGCFAWTATMSHMSRRNVPHLAHPRPPAPQRSRP